MTTYLQIYLFIYFYFYMNFIDKTSKKKKIICEFKEIMCFYS